MNTTSTLCLVLSLSAAACDKPDRVETTQTTGAKTAAADNTKVNSRDQVGQNPTPLDQGNGAADLETTQAIRKAVMADDSLSANAKNVKIITSNGTVTLRGPVKTTGERSNIETKAIANAGRNRVDDQLEVAPSN